MKKVMAIALLGFLCAGATVFGQVSISVGGGGFFTADFRSYTVNKEAGDAGYKATDYNSTLVGGGFYGFFDATYIEANLGLLLGNENYDKKLSGKLGDLDFSKGYDITALKIGIFGKYPFQVGGKAAVFPMIGLDIMLPLGGKILGKDKNDSEFDSESRSDFDKMFTQVWVKFGVGADFYATDNVFIRPEFMYGIRFNTEDETKSIGKYEPDSKDPKYFSSIFGHGLDIRVAVGYRF